MKDAVNSLTPAITVAYLASAAGAASVLPQIARTLRNRHMGGVAPLSYAVTSVACTVWMVYGARAEVWPQIPGNVLLVSGAVAIILLVPHRWSRTSRGLLLAGAMLVAACVAFAVPVAAAGMVAFGIGLFSAWPQVVMTLRGSSAAAGVSLATFGLRLTAGLGWLFYAVLDHDVPVLLSAVVMVSTTVLVLAVEARRRTAPSVVAMPVLEPA